MLKLTTDKHKASCGLSATAELLVQTGTIQKLGCGFLLAFHSNNDRISLTVYEIFSVKE